MKISGTDLVAWADRLDCRSSLPELVRRLIHCTMAPSKVESIDFPAGEGVQKHGVDGRLRVSEGNEFVPAGSSVWELGCSKDPKGKANDDYTARKTDPGAGVDPASTTFVFVTPRRWYEREAWMEEKRKEGLWADVRVFDADSLEQWLDQAPAARAWLGALLGKAVDAQDLASWWTEWALRTDPPTSDGLVRGGREEPWAVLSTWLTSPPSSISAHAEDPSEAAAYVYARTRLLPEAERDALVDRILVVSDDETLRRLMLEGRGMVIVALESQVELARLAAMKGHHVLRATATNGARQSITLGPLDRGTTVAALQRMNIAEAEAQRLAHQSGYSLARLRELLGEVSELDVELAPMLLVAAWNDGSPGDIALVSEIVGQDPEAVRELVRRGTVGPRAALVRAKDSVRWGSHLVAWRALARSLAPHDIERFRKAITAALAMPDPRYELEGDVRFAAQLYGKVLPHSPELRKGLVEALLMLAVGSDALGENVDGQQVADGIVATIVRGMTEWQHWATLDRFMPMLAEASPTAMLRELRRHIEASPELLRRVMTVDPDAYWGGGHSVGFVWAMQTLAWEPAFLPDATSLLARLAELDPGGNYHPRPFGGLLEIFVPWLPQTAATLEQRVGALAALARSHPELLPRVALGLLHKESSSPTHKPSMRPWTETWREGVPGAEIAATRERLGDLVLETCEQHQRLWAQVIPETRWLTPRVSAAVFERLKVLDVAPLDERARIDLAKATRDALSFATTHPDSTHSPSAAELAVLEQLLGKLAPADVRERHAWLFAPSTHLPDVSLMDFQDHHRILSERRRMAARELLTELTPDALLAYARERIEDRTALGWAIGLERENALLSAGLVRSLMTDEGWGSEFRRGLVGGLYHQDPSGFIQSLCDSDAGPFKDLSAIDRAEIALILPPTRDLWRLIDSMGAEAAARYWRRMEPLWVDDGDTAAALERLVAERPLKALEAAGMRAHGSTRLPPQLIVRLLRTAANTDPATEPDARGPMSYHVAALLKRLAAAGAEWHPDLVAMEWLWLPLVERAYQPTALFAELARNPESFVELVCRVFRGEEDRDEPRDEAEAAHARHAWRVLEAWDTLPGLAADGSIDSAALRAWVQRARDLLRERGRAAIGDERVGAVLAFSPIGTDNHWPHEVVREVIERLGDVSHIESGFITGRFNQRGIVTKQFGDGGAQELSLAQSYEASATALRTRSPTTARLLDALARSYRSDARREDMEAAQMAISLRPEAYAEDRARVFAEELQSRGHYTFTLGELRAGASLQSGEAERAVVVLERGSRLVMPEPGFFVIVPFEYRASQAPPPSWYIDDWMRVAKAAYYVGLLSAAAVHGAASQQPLSFQVIVHDARAAATVGRSRLEFIADAKAQLPFGIERRKTDTGFMNVSTPERTVFDLVAHAPEIGGVDLVASVIEELGETCDGAKLAELAQHYATDVVQRAGWILDHTGHDTLTQPLRDAAVGRDLAPVALRTERAGGDTDPRWNVVADAPLERDE